MPNKYIKTAVDADNLAMKTDNKEASRRWHRKAQMWATLALAHEQARTNELLNELTKNQPTKGN